jgi:NIPSNAP
MRPMITLYIRYTLDPTKLRDFEAYARALVTPIERCGGTPAGYYLPTKFAGPMNAAVGLIDFPSLAAYETYREKAPTPRPARLRGAWRRAAPSSTRTARS